MSDQTIIDGITARLPPYARSLGMFVAALDNGAPVIAYDFDGRVAGRPGFLHGGAMAGLLEIAAIAALRTRIDAGDMPQKLKPVNISVEFMRGGKEERTYAVGEIIRLGRRVANVEARAWQGDPAKPIATAFMNFLLSPAEG
ncbi:MAG: PaaI family thioesterase [Blastomonas sp.]